jgi:hypothetical protein
MWLERRSRRKEERVGTEIEVDHIAVCMTVRSSGSISDCDTVEIFHEL